MGDLTLGLDLGTNSIGWAIIEFDSEKKPVKLTDCGARIFQEAVDAKTKTPKNQARRSARSSRRLISRRKMRLDKLRNLLIKKNFLSKDTAEQENLFAGTNPYELRKNALSHKLEPYEIGRVLYHICHRRGFLSNRKTKSEDDGKVKSAISSLKQEINNSDSRTLGEYLAVRPKKRGIYTEREMYEREFEKIWQKQKEYYPDSLDTVFEVSVYKAIFFQRPLRLQKNLVGKCTFEKTRRRASRALLEYQRFRLLQDVNNLAVKNPINRKYRPLNDDERNILIDALEKQKTLGWGKVRKLLGFHEGEVFNLEEGKKKELTGNKTNYSMRSILKERWDNMGKQERESLMTDMLTIFDDNGLIKRLKSHYGFNEEITGKLAEIEFEQGYARLSRKAICKILPYLETGLIYDKACLAAGYNHSNPVSSFSINEYLPEPKFLKNPVVQKALFETRKVVNALVRKYGKFETVRIEMARDMKRTKKQKESYQKSQKENEKRNKEAEKILQEDFGIQNPAWEDIQKYNLWQECGMECPYTGATISKEMLFSGEVDIEHIIPYSRSLDDSYMNKTLCMANENRRIKHNKTPFEAYSSDPETFEQILQRVKKIPYQKRRKFEQEQINTDEFIERQLNDTRYICVEVKDYIQEIGANVEVSKGIATAALRYKWNMNGILSERNEKTREDHRHHAIDAVVIVLTSRGLFQELSELSKQYHNASLSKREFALDKPWPSFSEDLEEKIKNVIISHAPNRKLNGALHKDTAYGYNKNNEYFVKRIPLSDLTENKIKNIIDKKIKELVEIRFNEFNKDIKKAFGNKNNPLLHVDKKTPINSVRIRATDISEKTTFPILNDKGDKYKYFTYGNNHHVEIFENNNGERQCNFVTMLEAAKRARKNKTMIVDKNYYGPDWNFVMSLCINDIVEINKDGEKKLYRVQKMSEGKQMQISLKSLNDSKSDYSKNTTWVLASPNATKTIIGKKAIDTIGDIFPCND